MTDKLREALVVEYGEQVLPVLDELERRISITVTALLYFDYATPCPYGDVNRAFKAVPK